MTAPTLPARLVKGQESGATRRFQGRLAVYDDRGECWAESRHVGLARGEAFLLEACRRWNAAAGMPALVAALELLLDDHGPGCGTAECRCSLCVAARAALAAAKPKEPDHE